jgi:hypothetical protein
VGRREAYDGTDADLDYRSDTVAAPGHRVAVRFDGQGLSTHECECYGEQECESSSVTVSIRFYRC